MSAATPIWMAGGGVRGGMIYGATDEMGMSAVENPVDIHDLHATVCISLASITRN